MDNRNNNFDFLRLILASFVIITHSYPLSGIKECDFLCLLSKGQISFSYIGVKGFFVISGYLIFQSLQRSPNIIDYFWKRFLRLFPGLFIVLFLTVVLACFIYQGNIPFYYNKSLLTYLPNNLSLYRIQYSIDGVFETNPYRSSINGSLWTIPYEFTMYILLSFLIIFRNKKRVIQIILLVLFLFLLTGNIFYFEQLGKYQFYISSKHLLDLGVFFIAGALLATINIRTIKRKKELLIVSCIIVIASIYFDFYIYSKYITLPILFIFFGLNPIPIISSIGSKIGDLSYGIYIYGFPVQQTLMYYFSLNYFELMVYSMVISYIFAYFSWHLIEKRALKLKKTNPIQIFRKLL
ncbi:acyltransferase family protein [Elizabethkingia anophelis]|uniref:acyltransferase family protein n=1 Tax=Elizabethkingia anophelis TaxID=1117645 RepID=UPI0037326B08|nr:acyltransferase [Elizabethkingia anophelis]